MCLKVERTMAMLWNMQDEKPVDIGWAYMISSDVTSYDTK